MIASQGSTQTKKATSDIVGVDFATTGTKMVRIKRGKQGYVIFGLEELPTFDSLGDRLDLPKALRSKNLALAATSCSSVVRLLNLPGFSEQAEGAQNTVREHIGGEEGFRVSYEVAVPTSRGRSEARVLAVALPEEDAQGVLDKLSSSSVAPLSMEVSALAAMSGFSHGPLLRHRKETVAFIEGGASVTCIGIFTNGALSLFRKFDFGTNTLISRVQRQLGVDEETANDIVRNNSFDITQITKEVLAPVMRQISISREFVERKGAGPIQRWYLSGGLATTHYWKEQVAQSVGGIAHAWNPFESFEIAPSVDVDRWAGQEVRFAAAVGAAVGALEES